MTLRFLRLVNSSAISADVHRGTWQMARSTGGVFHGWHNIFLGGPLKSMPRLRVEMETVDVTSIPFEEVILEPNLSPLALSRKEKLRSMQLS